MISQLLNVDADMVADNQSFLMALHMVHDHIRFYEVGPDMEIIKELRQSVGKSRQCYQEYLEEQRKQKEQTEKN